MGLVRRLRDPLYDVHVPGRVTRYYQPDGRTETTMDDETMAKAKKIEAARKRVRAAQVALAKVVHRCYPVGTDIAWELRYELIAHGKVVEHSTFGADLWAVNAKTGTRLQVTPYQIVRAVEAEDDDG